MTPREWWFILVFVFVILLWALFGCAGPPPHREFEVWNQGVLYKVYWRPYHKWLFPGEVIKDGPAMKTMPCRAWENAK